MSTINPATIKTTTTTTITNPAEVHHQFDKHEKLHEKEHEKQLEKEVEKQLSKHDKELEQQRHESTRQQEKAIRDQFNCEHCLAWLDMPTFPMGTWMCSKPSCLFPSNEPGSKACLKCGTAPDKILVPEKVICGSCQKETKVPTSNFKNQMSTSLHLASRSAKKLFYDIARKDYVLCPRCDAPIKIPSQVKKDKDQQMPLAPPAPAPPSAGHMGHMGLMGHPAPDVVPAVAPVAPVAPVASVVHPAPVAPVGTIYPGPAGSLPHGSIEPSGLPTPPPSTSGFGPAGTRQSITEPKLQQPVELECTKCQEKVLLLPKYNDFAAFAPFPA